MQIRIGRRKYIGKNFKDPEYTGFKPIIVMTPSTSYGDLGPYTLKNENGYIIENIWQFSKIYKSVPKVQIPYSRYNKEIIWEHPEQIHITDDGKITDEYWEWRKKGFNNQYAVRYPVGFNYRHSCMFSLLEINKNTYLELDYIEARKNIYLPAYVEAVKKQPKYKKLQNIHQTENILIIEVDGPHEESMEYYIEKYGVSKNFIEKDTVLATEENMKILLNDPKHPFGHGYCLAVALLNLNISF